MLFEEALTDTDLASTPNTVHQPPVSCGSQQFYYLHVTERTPIPILRAMLCVHILIGLVSPWGQDKVCSCVWKFAALASIPDTTHTANWGIMSGTLFWHTDWIEWGDWGMRSGLLINNWNNIGYHDWAFQTGATRTNSSILWLRTWDRTLPTKFHGGLAYNFPRMLPQSTVKASTAIASGSGFQLTRFESWADSLLVNRSVESGPRSRLIF